MTLSKIRNHISRIYEMTNVLMDKEIFFDIKDELMNSVNEVLDCEVLSLNVFPNDDQSEILLVYTNNISDIAESYQKDSLKINSQRVYRIPSEGYSDFIWSALHHKQYDCSMEGSNAKTKAIFPLVSQDKVLGFIYLILKEGLILDQDDIYFLRQVALFLALSIEKAEMKKIVMESRMREREMALAFDMQQKIMSENNVPFFQGGKISYFYKYGEASGYMPYLSKRLGGDYCEITQIDDQKALIFVADVMGHGMASNYFVSMMKGVLKTCVDLNITDPDELLTKMNMILMKELDKSNLFITAQAMFVDFGDKTIRISNAGHTEPIMLSYKNEEFWYSIISGDKGIPLGIDETLKYAQRKIDVSGFDTILLYTDGIIEATNASGEEFGIDRMIEFCEKKGNADTEQLVHGLYQDVTEFSMNVDDVMTDDILLLAVSLGA